MEKTTIQISEKTLERLRSLKRYERESYDEIVNNLINENEEEVSEDEIKEIESALREIREKGIKKTTQSIEEVARELGVELDNVQN